jgi:hypothetical protein
MILNNAIDNDQGVSGINYTLSPYSPSKDDYPLNGANVLTPSKFDDKN